VEALVVASMILALPAEVSTDLVPVVVGAAVSEAGPLLYSLGPARAAAEPWKLADCDSSGHCATAFVRVFCLTAMKKTWMFSSSTFHGHGS
jgi:hypothetical protein